MGSLLRSTSVTDHTVRRDHGTRAADMDTDCHRPRTRIDRPRPLRHRPVDDHRPVHRSGVDGKSHPHYRSTAVAVPITSCRILITREQSRGGAPASQPRAHAGRGTPDQDLELPGKWCSAWGVQGPHLGAERTSPAYAGQPALQQPRATTAGDQPHARGDNTLLVLRVGTSPARVGQRGETDVDAASCGSSSARAGMTHRRPGRTTPASDQLRRGFRNLRTKTPLP